MRILIVNTVGFRRNGITSVILNYYRNMDRTGKQIDFCVINQLEQDYQDELESHGASIFHLPRNNPIRYVWELFMLLRKNKYDVVHIHGNSGTMAIETLASKLNSVKKIIIHTHNTRTSYPLINLALKYPMIFMADERLACSEAAGKSLYGQRDFIILNNAIDVSQYQYDVQKREKYRTEFNADGSFLIGHVGNFTTQKNHSFLLDVFREFHKCVPKSKLLLVGIGPLSDKMHEKVIQEGLQDAVIFAGRRSDAAAIYSAMDLFILPSNWEGLPLTMVEAQASGLPVLASDVITTDAVCTDRVRYLPLADGAQSWAKQLLEIKSYNYDRRINTFPSIAESGFDIKREADKLLKLYTT